MREGSASARPAAPTVRRAAGAASQAGWEAAQGGAARGRPARPRRLFLAQLSGLAGRGHGAAAGLLLGEGGDHGLDHRGQLLRALAPAAVVLDRLLAHDLLAVNRDGGPAVRLPGGLLGVVLQLDVDALARQPIDEGLDAACVVVPAPSVHVGAELNGDGRPVGRPGDEGIEPVRVHARHRLLVLGALALLEH